MATSFRRLYDNPPYGTIQDASTSTREPPAFNQPVSSTFIPNEIVDAPELAGNLVRWAQEYLDQVKHSPSQQLVQSAGMISAQLGRSQAGNEGTVASLYARIVETWSSEFVAHADNVAHQRRRSEAMEFAMLSMKWHYNRRHAHISFKQDDHVYVTLHKGYRLRELMRSGWWWSTKKAAGVFKSYCNEIRNLAVH